MWVRDQGVFGRLEATGSLRASLITNRRESGKLAMSMPPRILICMVSINRLELLSKAKTGHFLDVKVDSQQMNRFTVFRREGCFEASCSRGGDMRGEPAEADRVRSTNGHARSVGRVGGLAVALGIGAAALSGTAVASADTADAGTEPSAAASPTTQTMSRVEKRKAAREPGRRAGPK